LEATKKVVVRGIALPYLSAWRMHHGLSQRELATKSQVGQNTITAIETGIRHARPSTIKRLADALGIDRMTLISKQPHIPKRKAETA